MPKPIAIFFAGCNGAGKSTLRDDILKSKYPFIDADFIAKQVNFSHLPNADIAAGREAIRRFRYYLQEKQSFSIETTLSGVSALNNMQKAKDAGFEVHLYYCGLANVELNIARVADRVAMGGHNVAKDTIRRRYVESLQNLKTAMELADKYDIFDNSQRNKQHELCVVKDENRIHILRLPDWLKPYLPKNLLQQNLSVLTIEERLHCEVMQACLNAIQKDKPLILKGGTALMLGYGLERFSEDLDFDIADTYTGKGTIKLDSVLKNALPDGVKLQDLVLRKDTPSVTRYILHYQHKDISDHLKIEISYRTPVKTDDITHKNGNRFLSINRIADFKINTVLGNHSDARTKARDLFDTMFIVQNYGSEVNPALLNQLKQVDMNDLLSRYELAFVNDEIMQRHKISADEVVLSLVEQLNKPVLTIEERLTQARQLFKSKVDKLSLTERNKILAYEKGASEIWDRIADENTKNRLQVNFYTNAARCIENGEKLPPAMSNAAAKDALKNRRENNEPDINIDDDIEIDR